MGTFRENYKRQILYKVGKGEQDIWKASVSYLNSLGLQLSWSENDGEWSLYLQNRLIFTSHEWLAIQSFVYGMVHSALNISFRMSYSLKLPNRVETDEADTNLQDNHSLGDVFAELVSVNERIFQYERRFTTPGRAALMYRGYQKKQYEPKKRQDYEDFATLYERKLTLEAILKSLSKEGVDHLKSTARKLEPIRLDLNERFPVALAFLFLHLDRKGPSWYQVKGKWYYFEGDQLIFSAKEKDDFEAFILGMACSYAKLPNETLERYIIGS